MLMSSTNFNVGMMDARNSSRVLKPPGGGHSDIFGIYDQQEPQTPKAKYNQPRSTINEVFGGTEPDNNITNNIKQKTEEEEQKEENANENEAPPKPIPTPQRTRVPPGGFSSGLW